MREWMYESLLRQEECFICASYRPPLSKSSLPVNIHLPALALAGWFAFVSIRGHFYRFFLQDDYLKHCKQAR